MLTSFQKLPDVLYRCFLCASIIIFLLASTAPQSASAEEVCSEQRLKELQVAIISCRGTNNTCDVGSGGSSTNNLDYAGNEILAAAQLKAIQENSPVYQQAATQVGIPWQLLAVIHLREHGLKRDNPSNGQGVYQFVNKNGGPYPTGAVSEAEFLRQTILAAEFLKGKAKSNYAPNRDLTATATPEVIKDTLYSYNGRSSAYARQAASLGYDQATQGYEGSPYVMNKADAPRDPAVNKTTWGQVKTDGGPIVYPANNDYGAFVVYASLANLSLVCGGAGSGTFVWPEARSTAVTSCFGPRVHPVTGDQRMHYGIDMAGGEGTPILAAAAGEVTFAGSVGGYGPNYVAIRHNNGFSTGYGHMKSKSVSVGDRVNQGQQIGTEGNEGIGTGSHLHFNVLPGDYKGTDKDNVNPLQNGLTIPEGTANPKRCS